MAMNVIDYCSPIYAVAHSRARSTDKTNFSIASGDVQGTRCGVRTARCETLGARWGYEHTRHETLGAGCVPVDDAGQGTRGPQLVQRSHHSHGVGGSQNSGERKALGPLPCTVRWVSQRHVFEHN